MRKITLSLWLGGARNVPGTVSAYLKCVSIVLSIKTRKIQHETVHAVAVQPRWGRRGEWVQDYPGCAARSRPCAVESNVVGVSPRYATHPWISHIARPKPQRGFTILTVASPAKRRGQAIRSLALFQSTRSPSIA